MADKYWALVDLRYPAGDEEHAKATKGKEYKEIVVKAGEPLTGASEKSIKAFLSMGREIITTTPPASSKPERKEGVKA